MTGSISGLSDHISVIVSRKEVESGDIEPALGTLKKFLQSPEIMAEYFERVDIGFHGYDQDTRELFEIVEVRNYVYKLDDKFPFWLFFLSKTHLGLQCLLLCFLPPYLTQEGKVRLFPAKIDDLLSRRWFPAMNHLCSHVGFSEAQIESLTDRVVEYITSGRSSPG
jgi:hypothetical protein